MKLRYKILIIFLVLLMILTHGYYQRKKILLRDSISLKFNSCILRIKENPGDILRQDMVINYAYTYESIGVARALMEQYVRMYPKTGIRDLDTLLEGYRRLLYDMEYEGVTDEYREYVKTYQKYFDMLDVTLDNYNSQTERFLNPSTRSSETVPAILSMIISFGNSESLTGTRRLRAPLNEMVFPV